MNKELVKKIATEMSDSSNSELVKALAYLEKDFYVTKDNIIKLTERLDNTEEMYNKLLKEYKKRVGTN